MSTPAKRAANRRYAEKLDVIRLKPTLERGAAIRAAAAASGMSLQAYCLEAIERRIEEKGGRRHDEYREFPPLGVPGAGKGID